MSWFSSRRSSAESHDVPSQSRLEHHQILAGRLGHLNESQQAAFAKFKADLESAKLYTPGEEPSHDDSTLLRFLRARKFDPKAAQKQFAATEEWRKENDVDRLYATFDPEEFEAAKHFYPRWTGRRDKVRLSPIPFTTPDSNCSRLVTPYMSSTLHPSRRPKRS